MITLKQKKYYQEISIARGIGMICVILGHAFPDGETGISNSVANFLFQFVYSFHMPLFFIMAGFVFCNKYLACHGLENKKREVTKKAKRLLIPYFFYSLIVAFLKIFLNIYANHPFELKDLWLVMVGVSPSGGVWFLWTLFMITMLFLLFNRISPYILFVISIVLSYANNFLPEWLPYGFSRVFGNCIWFGLGLLLYLNYNKILEIVLKKKALILALTLTSFLIVVNCLTVASYTFVTTMLSKYLLYCAKVFSGVITVLIISIHIAKKEKTQMNIILNCIGEYSMDIFVLSYYVQVPIRVITVHFVSVPYWGGVFLELVLGIVIPIIFSKYFVRKMKYLKTLLLGI